MIGNLPYLSIVVTTRNDDHGGNHIRRVQIFVNGLAAQCERYHLYAELIIVEWNPPSEKPRIADVIQWPKNCHMLGIRIIEVPHKIHSMFSHADKLPLFQMIAKNVGIRRSTGQFVLATNIDVLFSDKLVSFLADQCLKKGKIYRIDRIDVDSGVPEDGSIEEQLAYCRNHILRINKRLYTQNVHEKWDLISFFKDYVILFFHKTYRTIRYREPYLHLNASGDFTLLSKEDWVCLRGNPEFEIYSLHLDSMLCYAAFYSGIEEITLIKPMYLYHIEHALGSGATPGKGSILLSERLARQGIKSLRYRDLIEYINQMRFKEKPVTFNSEIWGLSQNDLPEQNIL